MAFVWHQISLPGVLDFAGNSISRWIKNTGAAQPLEHVVTWVQQGRLSTRIVSHPLAEAAQAHAAFEQRQISGRVLLFPQGAGHNSHWINEETAGP